MRRVTTVGVVLAWMFFNGSINNVNKWLFFKYHFDYPLFVTACHQLACVLFSGVALKFLPQ